MTHYISQTITVMHMKKIYGKIFGLLAVLAASFGMTSCDDGGPWYDGYRPPTGWNNTFYDSRLNGYWELVQYNSYPVSAGEANYMYFNGDGRGEYYYMQNGYRYVEGMVYWCQQSVTGTSRYQVNIQYEGGGSETTNYWFNDNPNTLTMQWMTNSGRTETYVYDRIYRAPW